MSNDPLIAHAELYFRTFVHTALPLHVALVEAIGKAPSVPRDLATVLEDIGQTYMRLSDTLNAELVRRGELGSQADLDASGEALIEAFVAGLIARAGKVAFQDRPIDGRRAMEAFPAVADAIRTALLIEKAAS